MNKKELKINEKSQNKKSTKACPNLTSNFQSPNSNFSSLTSHFSHPISDHKAITLIALVITIIVMLILVGVTVSVAINGGLFNTAKDAARKTQLEADKESLLSAVIGAINDNAEVNFEGLNENLPEGFTITEDGYTSKSGNTFFVDRDGNIDTVTIVEKGTTKDDYGKYVKYGVDLNGDGILTNDWKVFYEDESGHTFIIAADYVTGDKCNALKDAIGADKAHMTKNTSSGFEYCYRWASSSDAVYHCYDGYNDDCKEGETQVHNEHTTSKTQCSYPETFMATAYHCSRHVGEDGTGGNINSRCASTLLCSGNWASFVNLEYGAEYAIGGPTLEMWVASWNQKHGKGVDKDGITLTANGTNSSGYGYYVGDGDTPTSTLEDVSSCTSGYGDELYFPHKTNSMNLDDDEDNETCVRLLACVSFSQQR